MKLIKEGYIKCLKVEVIHRYMVVKPQLVHYMHGLLTYLDFLNHNLFSVFVYK